MDIVDAQVHANVLGTEVTLAIMDALGIQGVLFDEYLTTADDGALHPGYRLANGAFRNVGPNAEAAALRHPERFAFLMRVDPLDPGIESWIETLAAAPGFKALRTVIFTPAEGAVFEGGGHNRLMKAARAHNLPVFVTCPRRVPHLTQYAERFPDVQFVIDHCGVAFDAPRREATIDDAVAMARYPNVAYKWAHAPSFLSTAPYPFPDLEPS
jgi:L-fuconolactonase